MKKEKKQSNPARRIPRELLATIDNEANRLRTDSNRLLAWLLRRAIEKDLPLKADTFIP